MYKTRQVGDGSNGNTAVGGRAPGRATRTQRLQRRTGKPEPAASPQAVDIADYLPAPHDGVTPKVQRKEANEAQVGGLVEDLVAVAPTAASILAAKRALRDHKRNADKLRANWLAGHITTAAAARGLIVVMQDALVPLHTLSVRYAEQAQPGLAYDVVAALEASQAEVHDSLTYIARAVITVRDGAKAGRTVANTFAFGALPLAPEDLIAVADADAMLFAFGHLAAPTGWQVPADAAAADAARFEFEACPPDAVRPGVCRLSDGERNALRARVGGLATRVFLAFEHACRAEAKGLEAMIKAERAARQFIVDAFTDVVIAGITAVVPPMSPAAKVTFDVIKKIGKAQLDKASSSERVAGEGTQSFLDALLMAMFTYMGQVADDVQALPDEALEATKDGLETVLRQRAFPPRLRALVSAYQEQVDPIGGLMPPVHAAMLYSGREILAVRIELPGGPRLAQVARTHRDSSQAPQHYVFLRWIDDTFAPISTDAPTVVPGHVSHLPIDAFLPGAP